MALTVKPFVAARPVAVRPVPRVVAARVSKVADPAALSIKNVEGADVGSANLALKGNANTKTRSEVRGGGKKPIAQKGTGNARMGSKRSPLIPGGGVSFGPRTKDWSISMNKKERRLALATALQSAASDIVVVDSLEGKIADRKTKSLVTACKAMGVDVMTTHTLIITSGENKDVLQSGKNVERLQINKAESLRMYDVLRADKIIMEQGALDFVNTFYQ